MQAEDLRSLICNQNNIEITEEDFRFKFKTKSFNQFTQNLVFEVSPICFKDFMNLRHLYLGMMRCPVKKFTITTKYFKYQRYGHRSTKCNSEQEHCGNCGEGHSTKTCTATTSKCINCTRHNEQTQKKGKINHSTFDKNCPVYLHSIRFIEERTDYG